ncbi:MAG: GDSL family lipase [Verrucomicrobia bacterium Tous-C9LFEB]|nr:MAG: GDSL family lipase [Verrucomicrobia bacterium Tous-C9LFEB]
MLFIGDSITQGWRGNGTPVWDKYFASKQAANFGISGDRTENLLWRLQNGNLNGIRPKAVVVLIGTNNIWRDKPEQVAEAIGLIVQEIKTRCPAGRVLLLGLFPRGDAPNTPTRKKIAQVNAIISNLHDGKRVFYLDIGEKFTNPEGAISKDIMFDFTHLTAAGYQVWADAIEPKLDELMR